MKYQRNITIASPLSAIAVEDNVFWMGAEEFYVYAGAVQRLPCSVRDYVFSNINNDQLEKRGVTASTNTAFSEVHGFILLVKQRKRQLCNIQLSTKGLVLRNFSSHRLA